MTHNEVVEIDGVEYEAQFEVEPAQKGGMVDPSWDSHVYDLSIAINGKIINPNDLDKEGFDYTDIYSDIEKQLNKKLLERDYD